MSNAQWFTDKELRQFRAHCHRDGEGVPLALDALFGQAKKANALYDENQRLRALLRLGRDLSVGVTGADVDDTIGSIKVHFEVAPTQWLRDAFEEWQREVEELIK